MIEVFDKTRRRVAILENAYAASESQKINSVWYFPPIRRLEKRVL